jgi:hypothetical protein
LQLAEWLCALRRSCCLDVQCKSAPSSAHVAAMPCWRSQNTPVALVQLSCGPACKPQHSSAQQPCARTCALAPTHQHQHSSDNPFCCSLQYPCHCGAVRRASRSIAATHQSASAPQQRWAQQPCGRIIPAHSIQCVSAHTAAVKRISPPPLQPQPRTHRSWWTLGQHSSRSGRRCLRGLMYCHLSISMSLSCCR